MVLLDEAEAVMLALRGGHGAREEAQRGGGEGALPGTARSSPRRWGDRARGLVPWLEEKQEERWRSGGDGSRARGTKEGERRRARGEDRAMVACACGALLAALGGTKEEEGFEGDGVREGIERGSLLSWEVAAH